MKDKPTPKNPQPRNPWRKRIREAHSPKKIRKYRRASSELKEYLAKKKKPSEN